MSYCIKKPTNCDVQIKLPRRGPVLSSMNDRNRIEYLVKYSVAPPPSRDYYGLKVFQDEVILYLWKISHGPHKAPIVYRVQLTKFNHEKSLQNEIRCGFGKYLLKYINNIAEGNRNTLLTLPISLIEKILRYLEFTDIIKLSSSSHVAYEIFNTDSIWQILYTRNEKVNISLEEGEKIVVHSWKQLFKDEQMQASIKNQRNLRNPSSITNNAKNNKLLMRPTNDARKSVSNKTSTINMIKKHSESSMADLIKIPLLKTISDTRFCTVKNEKPFLQTKNIRSTNSTFNSNEKNVKKNIIMSKTTRKRDSGNVSKHNEISDKQINRMLKPEKHLNKINNINAKSTTSTQESKLKYKTQNSTKTSISKSIGNIQSFAVSTQNLPSKTQSKIKSKPKKKVKATKSEILNTDKELSEKSLIIDDYNDIVRNDNFDLADLIASLKNIRSPQSIFDYGFSCVQQPKRTRDILDIKNEIQNIEKLKQLKSIRSSVTNNFSNEMLEGDRILEKLSEKSEPFSEASNESFVNDKKSLPGGDNKYFLLSDKYMKAREELRKSLDEKLSNLVSSQDKWDPDTSFRNKSFISPRELDNSREKLSISKRSSNTSFLKSYALNSLESKRGKDSKTFKEIK